ncbi:unnamed protein product, partial [Brassica oleracea]
GFGSPDHLRPSFPFIGLRLWVEEASSVLLFRLCFFGKRLSSLSSAYSGFFSGSVRSRPLYGFNLRRVPAKLLVVSSSLATSSRCRSWCSDRVTRVS